jgi:hypothetical protein
MRYVGLLINDVGEQSKNRRSDVTSTSGVSDNEILRYFRSAQSYIQSQILRQVGATDFFNSTTTLSLVGGQKSYTLPGDVYYNSKIKRVRYSESGLARDYYDLIPLSSERFTEDQDITSPEGYTAGNGVILLNGVPTSSSGNLRTTYVRSLDSLDKRRGKVQSVADDGTNYTNIILEDDSTLDGTRIVDYVGDFACFSSIRGVVGYYNGIVSAYDSGTRTLTLTDSPMSAGVIAVGSYLTLGEYTTTHSILPRECEHFLIEFVDWKLKKGDSSQDAVEANQEMVMLMDDIIAQFANMVDPQAVMLQDPYWEG